jgi:hypothetical protein
MLEVILLFFMGLAAFIRGTILGDGFQISSASLITSIVFSNGINKFNLNMDCWRM